MLHSPRLKLTLWWLLIGLIAAGVCSLRWPSAHFGDEYLPFGNDSFYHARRILDTVADPSAFYEFDSRIHAPEGSLVVWPWGYDYAMAWLVKAGLALGISDSPIGILIWIPVLAVFVSIGLMMLIARRLRLSLGLIVIAGLATALLPLTQYLHGVGQIDHHYAEYIFVLATIACGLKWFSEPRNTRAAILLGAVLGIAPAIHTALFILQLPVLATLLVFWLQDKPMPLRATVGFSATLVVTTAAVLLPSLPFRLGLFEFYTLSWFHLYVVVCSAAAALALAAFARNKRNSILLAILALALLIPLAHQIVIARAFLAGTIKRLDTIVEMHSLASLSATADGRMDVSLVYTLLLWLAPFAGVVCAWKAWQERATMRVFFWICCLPGLALMFTQARMHYFGSFVMYLPWLVLAQTYLDRREDQRKLIMLSASLVLVLTYWLPGRYQLGSVMAPAGDSSFRSLRPILEDLGKACAEDPGIVLADNDAGHYIRYYTDCSVIADNFLLTKQHEQKILQIDYLTSLPAAALPGAAPYVRYLLLRPISIKPGANNRIEYMSYSQIDAQLLNDLLLQPLEKVPSNYILIEQANIQESGQAGSVSYIRLFKVDHAPRAAPPAAGHDAAQPVAVRRTPGD